MMMMMMMMMTMMMTMMMMMIRSIMFLLSTRVVLKLLRAYDNSRSWHITM